MINYSQNTRQFLVLFNSVNTVPLRRWNEARLWCFVLFTTTTKNFAKPFFYIKKVLKISWHCPLNISLLAQTILLSKLDLYWVLDNRRTTYLYTGLSACGMTSMSDYFPIIYIYQQLGDFLKIVVKHAVNADFLKFPFVKVACYVFG